ncbi:uncharacterized protein Z519_11506 [Cladophialophora bantiana CBS 173.52]|uniref:Zn(2)-C6 fungal-type domain-containing protein n=1 Tax=Cladophialophora bantiana (strain ATCC 10958 / CBS 173.52 / CDC B-1940 / NIH 8579) TaxID=1442370 RepID=A0A0D2ECQ6_CLAB1|nr:uncharacterized protein Z519_11506 [Cladophialophora bantiana CBS 173.52]KIW87921.1 hypothetical protein Z519_11506 [Cladophialophora bantiana CBS 173.52]
MTEPAQVVKNSRKPRRRPAHLRTKTGCLNCRRRKKKCDEHLVVCRNCVKRNVDCIWPLNPNSKSKDSGPSLSLVENGASPTLSLVVEPCSRDTCYGIEDGEGWGFADLSTPSAPFSPTSDDHGVDDEEDELSLVLVPQLTSVASRTKIHSPLLFDFMRTVFVPQLVRPATDSQYIKDFTSGSLQLAYNTPFFMEALLTTRLYRSEGVSIHLYGAAALLKSCWKRMEASKSTPATWTATRILTLESFIFHVATSIPFQDPAPTSALVDEVFVKAQLVLERLWLERTLNYPYSPVLGVPPMLFLYVRQVALVYSQFRSRRFDVRQCHRLEQDLRWWSHDNIADSYIVNIISSTDSANEDPSLSLLSDLQNSTQSFFGPKLYILAAKILLRRMVAHSSEMGGQCLSTSLSTLLSQEMALVRSIEPSVDYFAEYYCWPFYCLGVSIDDPQAREMLVNKIMAFWKAKRNGTMKRLADILTDHWKHSAP